MDARPALILLAGEAPSQELLRREIDKASIVVAADGAAEYARTAGVRIHRIVGDLDSITESTQEYYRKQQTEIEKIPNQYSNDFEKALKSLLREHSGVVRVLGFSGRRTDHTLTNLSVLLRATEWFADIVVVDDHLEHFFLTERRPHFSSTSLRLESVVSLSPYGEAIGVRTQNLRYPLTNEDLRVGAREGLSNRVEGLPVEVSLRAGNLFVSIERQ